MLTKSETPPLVSTQFESSENIKDSLSGELQIRIPGAKIVSNPTKHVEYTVQVYREYLLHNSKETETWSIDRRYGRFKVNYPN